MKLVDRQLPLDKLLLDPNNYRLDYDGDTEHYEDDQFIALQNQTQLRLEKERLGELRDSMLENGFLEMDRIVVRKLKVDYAPPIYVVVEGNRRVAAFKGLIEDYRSGVETIPNTLIEKSESIGVISVEGSDEEISDFSATLMGIRHVSGPKKWAGYQSARLINDLVNGGKSFTEAGALLGISRVEAARRMRGYKALIQLRSDPVFGARSTLKHYALLLEFLSSVGKDWLEWDDAEFRFLNDQNRERLYLAIVGDGETSPEIANPTDARKFVKSLTLPDLKERLESGELLSDLPDFNFSNQRLEKYLKKVLSSMSSINTPELSPEELALVGQIMGACQNVVDEAGDDND